ncbi:hypothetical protein [Phaffia rhodozyma]|uniref:Uncharacterized protein n=1 Tax=Phaffia rhodozyma TaxID=264483 RepID=A0A0F7SPI2_PHARH|nr:hypothetical protein [Phaffia rhodozyma]
MSPAATVTDHGNGSAQQDQHQATQEQEIRDAHAQKFEEGKENAHSLLDKTDERSIKNTLAAAEKAEKEQARKDAQPEPLATEAARSHGNEPSRGAVIDEQLQIEDELAIKKLDAKH